MNDGGDCRTAPATPGLLKKTNYEGHLRNIKIKKNEGTSTPSGLASWGVATTAYGLATTVCRLAIIGCGWLQWRADWLQWRAPWTLL